MLMFGIDLADGSKITNLSMDSGTSDPVTNLDAGELFFRTDTQQLRIYNGSAWEDVNSAQMASGVVSSATGDVEATTVQGAIAELAAEKAPLASPAFTGTPTGIVDITGSAPKWDGSTQTTSTSAASGGVDGDIWFQY